MVKNTSINKALRCPRHFATFYQNIISARCFRM